MLEHLRRQHFQVKRTYPKAIALLASGTAYVTFEADAETVASVLSVPLHTKTVNGAHWPMAAIEGAAIEASIKQLIEAGHSVALCEQLGAD